MAKKTVALGTPTVALHTRSGLKKTIIQYYLGKETSNIGCLCGYYRDGKLVMPYTRYRHDLALVQYFECGINCFINPSGSVSIQPWTGVELTEEDKTEIRKFCQTVPITYAEFWAHETKFVNWLDANIKNLDGMTPEQAIEFLTAAGF